MFRPLFFWISCAGLCALPVPVLAQQVGTKVVITYNTLGMNRSLDGSIIDVKSDATNRVWAVAPGRVSAALGDVRAPLFPITVADTGLPTPTTTRFTSVTFAVPSGNAADGEHFYLGSSRGIAWGRLAATVDHRGELVIDRVTPVPEDQVNAVASDGSVRLWAATEGGLVLWDLSASAPTEGGTYLTGAGEGAINTVVVAPWGDAAATDGTHLHLVDDVGNESLVGDLGSRVFQSIAFDADGNLWAVTTGVGSGILKFSVNATGDGLLSGPQEFPLDPDSPSVGMRPTDIAVDRITGRVWVTTAGNQDPGKNAYYQIPDVAGDLGGVWGSVSSTFDAHNKVYADTSGNVWFGMIGSSNEALNGYVVRLLTLNKSRYLGDDTGVATLFDLILAGSGTVPITIAVGSDSRGEGDFTPIETGANSGTFVQTFRIVPSGAAGGSGSEFLVSSSAADIPVQASYEFTDADGVLQTLTATASWANIVPFEDDLWIGNGPCFLRSLGW